MTKRVLCDNCQYPIKTCLCEFLTPVTHQTQLVVLQHPSEVNQAKNTVRLLSKLSDNLKIFIGENEQDFEQVKALLQNEEAQTLVLFPSDQAKPLASPNKHSDPPTQLILIDGTWKKAKKIIALNPWLMSFPQVKLADNTTSAYGIRQTKVSGGLSTIEAAALALKALEGIDSKPFYRALDGLKHNFTKLMPASVKQRYR